MEEYSGVVFEDDGEYRRDGEEAVTENVAEEASTEEYESFEGDAEYGDVGGTEVELGEDSTDEQEVESDDDSADEHEVGSNEDSADEHEDDVTDIEDVDAGKVGVEGEDDDPREEFDETESIEMLADKDDVKSDDVNVLSEIFSSPDFTGSLKEGGEVVDAETVGGEEREQGPQRFELDLDESEDYSVETSDSPSRKEEKKDEDKDEEEDPFKIEVDD